MIWSSLAHIVLVSNSCWEYAHKSNTTQKRVRSWLSEAEKTDRQPSLTSICLALHSVCAVKLLTWAILLQMTCLMTRISTGSVGGYMLKRTCYVVSLVCALYLWRYHSLERIVHLCILPTCGVAISKATLESLQWLIMTAWGKCWELQEAPVQVTCLSVSGYLPALLCYVTWCIHLCVGLLSQKMT